MFCGLIVCVVLGGLYALGEYYRPQQKEISHQIRNLKVRDK